jgi:hypothetical protein
MEEEGSDGDGGDAFSMGMAEVGDGPVEDATRGQWDRGGGGSDDSSTVTVGWRAASIGQGATVWGGGFRFNFKWNFKRIQSNSNPFIL